MTEEKVKNNKILNTSQKTFKTFQALSLGIFALGVSSAIGDISGYYNFPLSAFSIGCTVFGLIGTVITEIMYRQAANW